jgi:hypothetical protein
MDVPDAADIVMSFDELHFGERSAVETVSERYEPAWSSTDDEQVHWLKSHQVGAIFADSANIYVELGFQNFIAFDPPWTM